MNQKQLVTLLVLAVVLGGAGLYLYKKQNSSWEHKNTAMGKKLLGDFPVNDVTRLTIRKGTNAVNLVKRDDLWRVKEREGYPANFPQISSFLLKARDLKVVQSETVGASQLPRLDLAPVGQGTNSAMAIEFVGKEDKPLKTLLIGKEHMAKPTQPSQYGGSEHGWPDGRYVKVSDSPEVALISDPLDSVEPEPASWLDKSFIRVQKAKSLDVTFPEATNSWKLTRTNATGAWKLADAKPGEELDTAKVSGLSNPLSSPSFADVRPGVKLNGTGTNRPTVVRISTFDNFDYILKIGQKTNEDYPVTVAVAARIPQTRTPGKDEKPADKAKLDKEFKKNHQTLEDKLKQEQSYGKWTYLVQSWSLDPLLKMRSQLMREKKVESKKADNVSSAIPTKSPAAAHTMSSVTSTTDPKK